MIRKRLVATVLVKNGWVVQSFGFEKYLPIGKVECIVENLDRWGVDEIILLSIDRSKLNQGPDMDLLGRVAESKISTPIAYGGGIKNVDHAKQVVRAGADRVCVDFILHEQPEIVLSMAHALGGQAIIGVFPVRGGNNKLAWFDYVNKKECSLTDSVLDLFESSAISEAMLIDVENEGSKNSFNVDILNFFKGRESIPKILFGGISESSQIIRLLGEISVSAVAIGNFLNYREHAVQMLKNEIGILPVRPAFFHSDEES